MISRNGSSTSQKSNLWKKSPCIQFRTANIGECTTFQCQTTAASQRRRVIFQDMEQINLRHWHQVLQKRTIKSVCDGPILKNGPVLNFGATQNERKVTTRSASLQVLSEFLLPEPWLWLQMVCWHSRRPTWASCGKTYVSHTLFHASVDLEVVSHDAATFFGFRSGTQKVADFCLDIQPPPKKWNDIPSEEVIFHRMDLSNRPTPTCWSL